MKVKKDDPYLYCEQCEAYALTASRLDDFTEILYEVHLVHVLDNER